MSRNGDKESVQEFMKRRQEELEEEQEFLEVAMDREEQSEIDEWDP